MHPHENASTHQRHAPHANTHKNRVVRAADGLARPKAPNRPLEQHAHQPVTRDTQRTNKEAPPVTNTATGGALHAPDTQTCQRLSRHTHPIALTPARSTLCGTLTASQAQNVYWEGWACERPREELTANLPHPQHPTRPHPPRQRPPHPQPTRRDSPTTSTRSTPARSAASTLTPRISNSRRNTPNITLTSTA